MDGMRFGKFYKTTSLCMCVCVHTHVLVGTSIGCEAKSFLDTPLFHLAAHSCHGSCSVEHHGWKKEVHRDGTGPRTCSLWLYVPIHLRILDSILVLTPSICRRSLCFSDVCMYCVLPFSDSFFPWISLTRFNPF
jgi:hypothetical protein